MATTTALVFAGKSVATPAISFLINKAFSDINKHFKSEDMDELKNRLLLAMPKIQAVLDVVIPEHVREQSSALDAWLWQLRDAVEAAEDAIDELEYYELEEKAKHQRVSDWGSPFGKMKHKFARSVKSGPVFKKIIKKTTHGDSLKRLKRSVDGLDKAAAGVVSFLNLIDHLSGVSANSQRQLQKVVDNSRQTGSTLSATIFVGREKEKEQITGWLANTSVESCETGVTRTNNVPIISVVGHGGMGKTTLAQSICEQDEVLKHFKVIWITVSTSFDATSLTSKMLECVTGAKPSAYHLEPLQRYLIEKLKSNKFLLVLDDVWEDRRRDEWEKLFAPMRKVNIAGSKILLTTRMQSVVDMATTVMGVKRDVCLALQGLGEDENIELFIHHAFSGLNPQDCVYLKSTGRQIAKRLRGLPLVTKVVGEHLQGNMTLEYWSRFLDQGLEHFKGTEDDIMKVLRLSYYHLPTELHICFRYCCIFPQDYRFNKKELVQLWIGSGLISLPASDTQTLEDTGEQFLVQLTRKSFFEMKPKAGLPEAFGLEQEGGYVMHDMMHELARDVSTGECARIDNPVQLKYEKDTIRHLCIINIHRFSADEVKKISYFKNVHSIIIYNYRVVGNDIVSALEMVVESSKSLRLFHSKLRNTFRFADKFGNLKHLRYIYLHQISPNMICGVAKLYHLMLLRCSSGLETDNYIVRYLGNLERLRHVSYGRHGFGKFPISKLTSLQELYDYRVGGRICSAISAIGNLTDLRELGVQGLENVENYEEVKNAKLKEKQRLNSLFLEWSTPSQVMTDDLVLNHLEPHVNIKVLGIQGYGGPKIPFWIEKCCVKNLVSLRLIRCINWEYLPSLGDLVLLKLLILENLPKLRQIGRSSDMSSCRSMELLLPQSLDTLVVTKCRKLIEIPILPPSLVSLKVHDVWLTKLPMIGKISSESIKSKSSKLTKISVTECPYLTSLEVTILEQEVYMGALPNEDDCIQMESTSIPFEEMKELPQLGSPQLLTNLSRLELKNCLSLVSLPSTDVFKSLRSLRVIVIWGCHNLLSLGGLGSLPSLLCLEMARCSKLMKAAGSLRTRVAFGSGGKEKHLVEPSSSLQLSSLKIDLPSLLLVEPLKSLCHSEHLTIGNGSEMESLPERWLLQNRTSLRILDICKPDSLKSLPPSMQDLCSLETLWLSDAGQLQSLPHLPSSLKKLILSGCHPDLEKNITNRVSPEWNKIAHVAFAKIGTSTRPLSSSLDKFTVCISVLLELGPDCEPMTGDWYFIMGKKFSQEAYCKLSALEYERLTARASLHDTVLSRMLHIPSLAFQALNSLQVKLLIHQMFHHYKMPFFAA